jgi:hypothetical protein
VDKNNKFAFPQKKSTMNASINKGRPVEHNIYLICPFPETHEKIVRLDISMQERLGMNEFDTIDLTKRKTLKAQMMKWGRLK